MKKRSIVSDGTNVFMAGSNGVNSIVISTKVSTSLSGTQNEKVNSLTYGNSILYGSTQSGIYSIHATTGAMTAILKTEGIDAIMYASTTTMVALRGNSLLLIVLATGAYTYLRQDV